jgi:hypothetical protein
MGAGVCHDLGDLNVTDKIIAFHNRWTSGGMHHCPKFFFGFDLMIFYSIYNNKKYSKFNTSNTLGLKIRKPPP